MKLIKQSLALLLVLGLSTSCKDFFKYDDGSSINDDTDRPFTSTPDNLLPAVIGNFAQMQYDHAYRTSYITQHLNNMNSWNTWNYSAESRIPEWRRHYHDVGVNAKHVMESSNELKNAKNYFAVSHIVMAISTQMTSDMFGDLAMGRMLDGISYPSLPTTEEETAAAKPPFYQAFTGNPAARYDDQIKVVYPTILKRIETAITAITDIDSPQLEMSLLNDNVYGGDMDKWKKLAFAHKSRVLLHLANIDNNYEAVIDAVKGAEGFESAYYDFSVGDMSNAAQQNPWGVSVARFDGWSSWGNKLNSSTLSEFFAVQALQYNPDDKAKAYDPRTELFANGFSANADDKKYLVAGSQKPGNFVNEDYPDLYGNVYTKDNAKMPIMTSEELNFISAEANFKLGNKAEALKSLKKGVKGHMAYMGVANADIDAFINNAELFPATEADLTISAIMMQKYVAMYLQSESWVDMRRYDYSPSVYSGLRRPNNLIWFFEDEPDNVWVYRIPYDPQTEELYNKPQLEELGAYQDPNWLKVKMGWNKK